MKIKIKRFDKKLPLPSYKSKGAACFDLYVRKDTLIPARGINYIPMNIAVEIPKGNWLMLVARGSTHKLGLMLANGLGVGDWDFCGNEDEYSVIAYNFTDKDVKVDRGMRIAQAMIMDYKQVEFEEVDSLDNPNRGMLGSTGLK